MVVKYILEMEKAGADLIEIGIPFSDPTAEGVVIQDDDRRWFKRISHAWHDEDYILVTIEEQR